MKLCIKNLAHIREATIEEKDLTLIIGDNGSGKTLILETLIYVKKMTQSKAESIIASLAIEYFEKFNLDLDFDEIYTTIEEGIKQNADLIEKEISSIEIPISSNAEETMNNVFKNKMDSYMLDVEKEVEKRILFSDNPTKLQLKLLDIPKFHLELKEYKINIDIFGNHITLSLYINDKINRSYISTKNFLNTKKMLEFKKMGLPPDEMDFFEEGKISKVIEREIIKLIIQSGVQDYFGLNGGKILYLPSERSTYIRNSLSKVIEMNKSSLLRYSEETFIKDYLSFKEMLSIIKTLGYVPDVFEKLLGGELNVNEEGEIDKLIKGSQEVKSLLFSTKINRLLPYLLIFQPLEDYQNIIVEEPEAHLSLKSINDLIGFFEYLLKRDKKLIITTHSDVFFTRMNNLLLQNEIDVNVYELHFDGEKSHLNEVPKREYGYNIDLFTSELENLYEETIEIQNEGSDNDNY